MSTEMTTEQLVAELCKRAGTTAKRDDIPESAKPMVVCSGSRWVHFGYVEHLEGAVKLHRARCAIYWGTTRGVGELAVTGPTSKTRVGSMTTTTVTGVQCMYECTPQATEEWEKR